MAARYITDRFMPDKAIDLIDEASSGAHVSVRGTAELKEALAGLQSLNRAGRGGVEPGIRAGGGIAGPRA